MWNIYVRRSGEAAPLFPGGGGAIPRILPCPWAPCPRAPALNQPAQRSPGGELNRNPLIKHVSRRESKQNIYFVEFRKPGNRCKYSLSLESASIHRLFIVPNEYLPGDRLAIRPRQCHPKVRFNGLFSPLNVLETSPMRLLGKEDPAAVEAVFRQMPNAS